MIPVLFVVSIFAFLLIHLIPGDPAATILGAEAPREALERLREEMGLNRPIPLQYVEWLSRALSGDLGDSVFMNMPITELIAQRLPVTIYLATYALFIAIFVGVPLGVTAAVRRGKWPDRFASILAVLVLSMPSFWLGLNLIFLFAVELRWFPSSGFVPLSEGVVASIKSLTLPAISLGLVQAALITRMTRSSMLDVLGQDYTRTARAKGLPERIVIYRHALKNAMIPTLTVIGLVVGILLGGAVIIEEVFSLPGIGQLVVTAVTRRDYPTVQGAIFFVAFMYLIVNQLVDVAYRLVDPRIKYGR